MSKEIIVEPEKALAQDFPIMKMMEIAITTDGGIEKLEKLMDLQDRMEKIKSRRAYFDAMARFQESTPKIEKKGRVSFNKTAYSYAKLEDIAEAIKKPLAENGLSFRFEQKTEQIQSGIFLTVSCIITHCDGHFESTLMSGYPDASGGKNPIQQIASTVQYLRRYTLTGILGITSSDEDNDCGDQKIQQAPERLIVTQENHNLWNRAIAAYKRDGNFDAVLKGADISIENQKLIVEQCKNV